jgi:hypothetical protein
VIAASVAVLVPIGLHSLRLLAFVALGACIFIGVFCVFAERTVQRRRRKARTKANAARAPLDLDVQLDQVAAETGLERRELGELWIRVAELLKLDPSRMRPDDHIEQDYFPKVRSPLGLESPDFDLEDLYLLLSECRQDRQCRGLPSVVTLRDFLRDAMNGSAAG